MTMRGKSTAVAVMALCAVIAVCSGDSLANAQAQRVLPERPINTRVYQCVDSYDGESFSFTVRLGPGELALWLPFKFDRPYLVLAQDFETDEAIYREGDVRLSLEPDQAQLDVADKRFSACSLDPVLSVWEHAKLSGVDYRATGAGPDWVLELRAGGPLLFATEDGSIRLDVRTPEPETDAAARITTYRAETQQQNLTVTISDQWCSPADGTSMSGSSVTVEWEGRAFTGCGRPLH